KLSSKCKITPQTVKFIMLWYELLLLLCTSTSNVNTIKASAKNNNKIKNCAILSLATKLAGFKHHRLFFLKGDLFANNTSIYAWQISFLNKQVGFRIWWGKSFFAHPSLSSLLNQKH